ncbi:MAG: hypothetical protein GY854_02275 [Deltaproteobacteria bacterium]|nr:hypothetical protein [Deltaproteobacteria bacterium]
MSIPLAVSPSTLVPGLYLKVDLLAGAASPGIGQLKVALLASKSSAGDLTDDTEVRAGAGEESAKIAFGPGTVGHLAAKQIYSQHPMAMVDFISPVPGSGTATMVITLDGDPVSNNVIDVDIMGRTWEVSWLVGESAADVATKVIDSILQRTNHLACTAVSGGGGIATINSKVDGHVGNDINVFMKLRGGATGTETINASTSVDANLASGATDPDFTNALASIAGEEYHYILPCLSNADVKNVVSANNLSRIVTHIGNNNEGLDAKLQMFVAGFTGTSAEAVATTPHANSAGNKEYGEVICCVAGRGLPGEIGGREVGGRLAAISLDPAANRIGEKLDGYVGARDKIAKKPTAAELQTALSNGVSMASYTAQGLEMLVRAVTTHSQDDAGGPDTRLLDTQNVDAAYIIARDLRSALWMEFQGAKISKDIPPGEEPPPAGVIEERDIKSFVISRLRYWQQQGVADGPSLDEAITGGTLIVQVNESDATQVDCVIPFKVIQPLAKMGVVAQRMPS